MATLNTTYLGIPVQSPMIVASSTISSVLDRIKAAEAAGAGALVFRTVFEEQLRQQRRLTPAEEEKLAGKIATSRAHLNPDDQTAIKEHLLWIEKVRANVQLPLIGSLNAVHLESWEQMAADLESAGVNALELNAYAIETHPQRTAAEIEQVLYELVERVAQRVKIPVAVKLSPFYTGLVNVITELDQRGTAGFVLFNRFLQPDIQLETMTLYNHMELSSKFEMQLPLRWTAILYGRVKGDLIFSTGIQTGQDALKALLAGAQAVQVASTLLRNGVQYLETMNEKIRDWMDENGIQQVDEMRGRLSQQAYDDPGAFERAQYIDLLTHQH
ncbi:MAG: dihydroorotate dehydrogenase-like protein [Anaerolineae bacterium]|nr:dihydroorotate dehydrogenase-like protein [Anaerolineae bacterium]